MGIMQFMDRAAPLALDPAIVLLGNEEQGLAIDWPAMRGFIRDRATAANNWLGDPNAKLTYASPSAKWIWNAFGVLSSGTTLRCDHDPASLDSSVTPLNSLGIGAGAVVNKSIVLASGAFTYPVGEVVRITDAADITKWILGRVVSWTAGTKTLVIAGYAASAPYVSASSWKVIVALGIRVESQRTNLCLRAIPTPLGSMQWSGASWDTSRTRNGIFGATAYSFLGDGTGSKIMVPTLGTAVAAATVYCLSAIIEQEDALTFAWGLYGGGAFTTLCNFTWATSAITTAQGTAPVASGVIELGKGPNGGRMVQVWAAITAVGGEACYIYPNGTGTVSTSTIFHACQIEAGSFPTSLINSTGTQVTRAADNIDLLLAALPSGLLVTGSFLVDVRVGDNSTDATGGQYRSAIGMFDTNLTSLAASFVNRGARLYYCGLSASNYSAVANAIPVGAAGKMAGAWDQAGAIAAAAGTLGAQTSPGVLGPIATLRIGRATATGGWLNGHLRGLKVVPRRANNAELQAWAA